MRVPARPAQHIHRRVPDLRRRTRRSASTIGGGTPDMTIGCADADRVGARPYRRHADTFLPHADTPTRRPADPPTRSPVTLGQRAEKK
jgi:hypothetical protein